MLPMASSVLSAASVQVAKERQTKLLQILWNAITDRPNTTVASSVAAFK